MSFNPKEPFNLPALPPKTNLDTVSILKALNDASRAIGELKGYCSSIPNPMMLMSMAVAKESVESSKIEDIHTTVENVLEGQILPEKELKREDKEVLRYREAMNHGYRMFKDVGLTTRAMLGIHEKLIAGSAGFRRLQNAIMNDRTGEKVYTPPLAKELSDHLGRWENYVNGDSKGELDPLIRCAISHYQFEAIHPFGDGNGRTGRILLSLQIVSEGLLAFPVLYMSGYLNKNRAEYYHTLMGVTEREDWEGFVLFMLRGFTTQAEKTKQKLFIMMAEYELMKEIIREKHPKMNAIDTVNHLFASPVTTPKFFSEELKIHYQTATKYLNELKSSGILRDTKLGKNRLFYNVRLFELIN